MNNVIKIQGDDVLEVVVTKELRDYDANTKMAGKKYRRAFYNGMGFAVPEEESNDLLGGKAFSIKILEVTREDADGNSVPALQFDSLVTKDAIFNHRKGNLKIESLSHIDSTNIESLKEVLGA